MIYSLLMLKCTGCVIHISNQLFRQGNWLYTYYFNFEFCSTRGNWWWLIACDMRFVIFYLIARHNIYIFLSHLRHSHCVELSGLRSGWYTGGQKFGILTLISLSLKNTWKNQSKNLCLVKFEVLGYENTQKLLGIISMSDPQISLNK